MSIPAVLLLSLQRGVQGVTLGKFYGIAEAHRMHFVLPLYAFHARASA
jgi:hypothetical protein